MDYKINRGRGFFWSCYLIWCQTLHGISMMWTAALEVNQQILLHQAQQEQGRGRGTRGHRRCLKILRKKEKQLYFWLCNVVIFVVYDLRRKCGCLKVILDGLWWQSTHIHCLKAIFVNIKSVSFTHRGTFVSLTACYIDCFEPQPPSMTCFLTLPSLL